MLKNRIIAILITGAAALCVIAVHSFLKARRMSHFNVCIDQMYKILCAKEIYALENDAKEEHTIAPKQILEYMGSYFSDQGWTGFHCPSAASNTYTMGGLREEPICSVHGSFSQAMARAKQNKANHK